MEWLYDNYCWWVDAIHQSTCPMRNFSLSCYEGEVSKLGCSFDADAADDYYASFLREIAGGRIPDDRVEECLFRAKALRKWRLADRSLASKRKVEAIAGFYARNDAARDAGPIPFPFSGAMKRILRLWLGEYPPASDVLGSLGPLEKACAEKYTAPRKLAKFAEWCRRSRYLFPDLWWPEGHLSDWGSVQTRVVPKDFPGWAPKDAIDWPEVPYCGVPPSGEWVGRLAAVPKQRTKDRLITVENLYAKYAQQWVRQYLQEAIHVGPLRGTCMDLGYVDGQAIQRRLALKASKDGILATLDLSDASDRITWDQVRQVFPAWVVTLLEGCRSPSVMDEEGIGAKPTPLFIYAGMGNATTFTIETLFFAAFVKAYAWAHGLRTRVSVFGDDVICSSETASRLAEEDFSFFKVNAAKSFWGADLLRESCGIFAYKGTDVTTVKIDGYTNSFEGRIGVCDLHRRLYASKEAYCQRLSYLIGNLGILVNWPYTVEGYPSICDDRLEYSQLPRTRWDHQNQHLRAQVVLPRPKKVTYVADDGFSRKYNHPPALQWLWCTLAGLTNGDPASIRQQSGLRRKSLTCAHFSFPSGGEKYRQVWSRVSHA